MNIKHLVAAGLSLALVFTISRSGLGFPTPTPAPSHVSVKNAPKLGLTPTPRSHVSVKNAPKLGLSSKSHVSVKDAPKLGLTPTRQVHVSVKNAPKLGITPTPKVRVSVKDAPKLGLHPSSSVPGTAGSGSSSGGSGSSGGGSFPGGMGGGNGGHGGHGIVVIVPIVLPYPNAVVQAEPGQIILPAGSVIPEGVAQLDAEARTGSSARGCYALTVSTLWNGSFGPASQVNLAVEARNCRPNHRYGIALFSADLDTAKSPTKIGTLQTDQDGYGFQSMAYSPSKLTLNYTVGLYELEGDDMIAGPMTQAWAGKIGSPGTL